MSDREKLKALAMAATPGEWFYDEAGCWIVPPEITDQHVAANTSGSLGDNIRFIAAANPTTILALLAEIGELEKALGEACGIADGHINTRLEIMHGISRDSADANLVCLRDHDRIAELRATLSPKGDGRG